LKFYNIIEVKVNHPHKSNFLIFNNARQNHQPARLDESVRQPDKAVLAGTGSP
jgi:hypothetical protein